MGGPWIVILECSPSAEWERRVGALPTRYELPRAREGSGDPLSWLGTGGGRSASRRAVLAWRAATRVSPARGALLSEFRGAAPRLESRP